MGNRNRQNELEQKVERLEAKVKLLEEKIGKLEEDKASKIMKVLDFTVVALEVIAAILTIVLLVL